MNDEINNCVFLMLVFISSLDFKQKIYQMKSEFFDKKVILCDLKWPLGPYYILYFCFFSICDRKKSLNPGITDSQSLGVPEFFCET